MNGMKIDFITKTITITKAFRDAACEMDSEEYAALSAVQQAHPDMRIVLRSIRKGNRANENKGLTYRYMRKFIALMDSENLATFEQVILYYEGMYMENASVYQSVKDWFLATYPDHKSLVVKAAPRANAINKIAAAA